MMRTLSILVLTIAVTCGLQAQNLKPYLLGAEATGSMSEVKTTVDKQLKKHGLKILGSYMPANDSKRYVYAVSSSDLISAVKSVGGLTGFAAAQRVALTEEGGKILISYTNPPYWGNAYFRDDYDKVKKYYDKFAGRLKKAMKDCGKPMVVAFGSEEGEEIDDLRDYSYMIMMPEFDDTNVLREFGSYSEAVKTIDAKLKKGVKNVSLVYAMEIPGKQLKLYGIGLSGPDGEADFMPTIDIAAPKHTAFLPYEMLVMGNEVHMLHGRFRIALSFPDLTMGTFTKIMSTPGDIEDLLTSICE
ncbi:MAG: hypothetical protein C0600_03045 [Ignavibacteria bacterium]|nr:MAG: hypothetical protein C0600_03045 [Ignavibacteria bacterium]